ncbi:hypothetical protein P8452_58438 [Trifolium repens]|nr:hypothetical protein P8452_58438 [Trifolium repens]
MSYRPNANARTEVRRSRYKVVVDAKEGRRRREDNLVEIRKNRREENLQKKRREALQAQQMPELANYTLVEKKLEHLPALRQQLSFGSCFQLIERSPPIEEVIQAGVVPRFIEFLMGKTFHNFNSLLLLVTMSVNRSGKLAEKNGRQCLMRTRMYIATTEYEKTLRAYNLGLVFDLFFLWWKSGDVPYCESPSSEFDHVKKGDTLYDDIDEEWNHFNRLSDDEIIEILERYRPHSN